MDLNSTLKEQLLPDSNLYFSQARSLNGISTLGLVDGEQMRAVCDSCQTFGEKILKLILQTSFQIQVERCGLLQKSWRKLKW